MTTVIYTGTFRFPIGDAAAQRVLNNGKILRNLGHEVIFISYGGQEREVDKGEDGNYYYDGFRYIISNDIDIKSTNFFARLYNYLFCGRHAYRKITKLDKSIYLIIGYGISSLFTRKMLKFTKKRNSYFVSDITEWYNSSDFVGGLFSPLSWINNYNMYFTQHRVENKILISSFLNDYYRYSNNLVLPPLTDSSDLKWRNVKSVLPEFDGVRIIYAGTPAKKDLLENVLIAVHSCLKVDIKLQLVVVGVNQQDIRYYENFMDYLMFPGNIIFCGRVKQTDVPAYYNVSDFSIFLRKPTRKSMAGFPTKLAETMTAGCPVILNYTSDIACFVQNGYNGFVLSDWSVCELEKVLRMIVDLPITDLQRLKTNARICGTENFDYTNYIEKTNNFLYNLK